MTRARRRLVGLWVGGLLFILIAFIVARWATGNFGTVEPGRIYRSGQPGADLTRTIRRYGIKTVLNLRGPNSAQSWYRHELEATLAAGATHIDVPMASDQWLSRDQAQTLVDVLERAEPPLLIHCEWGAERTGLVAAMAVLLRPGATLEDAERQFSAYYLFLPIRDGRVMLGHLRLYRSWLQARGWAHSPSRFKEWVARGYRPRRLSREYWPYDPYPLKLTIRRAGGKVEEVADWSRDRAHGAKVHR
ncbi:MAG: tyrosine-protein phosphatase [Isosphaeraceae bacterium]|nr:tyrosine-protein phosphatase [Isosphaeraceae bacterium]